MLKFVKGSPSIFITATGVGDDVLLGIGTGNDGVLVLSSAGVGADTALTNVLIGTPESQAIAANSLMISNVTASGDIAMYVNKGGNSQMVFFADGSTGDTAIMAATGQSVDAYIAGVKVVDIAANGVVIDQAALDTAILSFRSSDVATGLTTGTNIVDVTTTDYGALSKFAAVTGGLLVQALGENAAVTTNLLFESYGGQADTTKSTAGRALVEVYAAQHDGANTIAAVTANGNIFAIRGHTVNTVAIWDEDGDSWQAGGITTGGGTPTGYFQNLFGGTFTSDGSSTFANKNRFDGVFTGASGDTNALAAVTMNVPIVTQTAAETIGVVAELYIAEPTITKNVTTITVASTLYIVSAPTEGTTNAAIYVASGDLILASGGITQAGAAGTYTTTLKITNSTTAAVPNHYYTILHLASSGGDATQDMALYTDFHAGTAGYGYISANVLRMETGLQALGSRTLVCSINTTTATWTTITHTGFVATNSIALGVVGSALGTLNINGNTSGTVSVTVDAAAGTTTFNVTQRTGTAVVNAAYGTGDLDTEAEIIAAINANGTAINLIRAALNASGLTTTV